VKEEISGMLLNDTTHFMRKYVFDVQNIIKRVIAVIITCGALVLECN